MFVFKNLLILLLCICYKQSLHHVHCAQVSHLLKNIESLDAMSCNLIVRVKKSICCMFRTFQTGNEIKLQNNLHALYQQIINASWHE